MGRGSELRVGGLDDDAGGGPVTEADRASCRADGSGRLLLNRPPRPAAAPPTATVAWPDEPVGRARTRLNLLAVAVPLVGALVLAAVTRTPGFLMIAALSPLVLVGSWAGDLLTGRRSAREARREHERALSSARARGRSGRLRRGVVVAIDVPRPGCAALVGGRPTTRRVVPTTGETGLPPLPARSRGPPRAGRRDRQGSAARATTAVPRPGRGRADRCRGARHRWTPLVPAAHGPGPGGAGRRLAQPGRRVAGRAQRCRGGLDLDPVVAARDPVAGQATRAPRCCPSSTDEWPPGGPVPAARTPVVVVVMDGAEALRRLPGTRRLLTEGPAVGLVSICCDRDLVALPAECTVTVELGIGRGSLGRLVERDGTTSTFLAEGVGAGWVRRFAGAVAPLRDASGVEGGPGDVRLLDLCGTGVPDPSAVVAGWRSRPTGTCVPLGVGTGGRPVRVDLARDGPHALVAGTTGSGKSELLQTLVCALARPTVRTGCPSCWSTTRAVRRSVRLLGCRTPSAWSPTSTDG